jgi:hypothetical protein
MLPGFRFVQGVDSTRAGYILSGHVHNPFPPATRRNKVARATVMNIEITTDVPIEIDEQTAPLIRGGPKLQIPETDRRRTALFNLIPRVPERPKRISLQILPPNSKHLQEPVDNCPLSSERPTGCLSNRPTQQTSEHRCPSFCQKVTVGTYSTTK